MQYFGGKQRISKPLSEFLNTQLKENQVFVDLFCGSCNVISKVKATNRIGNDKHYYLTSMWIGLQEGWLPPDSLTAEQYQYVKSNLDEHPTMTGFVGFGCSFSGKWFGGYARAGGRNYCLNAKNSVMLKMKTLQDVAFTNKDYSEVDIPPSSLIYCDIPYKNTTPYCKSEVGVFDHEEFYGWVKAKISEGHDVYVSEYLQNVPEDAVVVWSHQSKKDIRDKNGIQQPTTEVLFTYKK